MVSLLAMFPARYRRVAIWIAGAAIAVIGCAALVDTIAAGCRGRDDLDGSRRPIPGLGETAPEHRLRPPDTRVVFDLYDNRASAVVHERGVLIVNLGAADAAKYIEGGYRSAWELSPSLAGAGDQRAALVPGLSGSLYVPIDGDDGGVARAADGSIEVALRARPARGNQLVSVLVNERRIGDISMRATDWGNFSLRVPAAAVREGENKLRLYFRHTGDLGGSRTAAAIARVAVGAGAARAEMSAEPIAAVSAVRGDQRLSALQSRGPGRLSYYLAVPRQRPALVLAIARADGGQEAVEPTPVRVRIARAQGGAAVTVWEGEAGADWDEARIGLADHAGEVIRLDLVSDGAVAWGRPQIVVSEPAGRAADLPGRRPPDHIIVWVVSALRADRVGGPVPTPGFERLAARGLAFSRAVSTAPAPGPAHVALLTGRYPSGGSVPDDVPTLGQRFSDAGYTTALISGNGFVNDEAGFARGFAVYDNPMRRRHPFRARILWQRARRLLTRHKDGRTFIYLVTVEPHLPYRPSAESLAAQWDRGPMRFAPAETAAVSERVAAGTEALTREERAYVTALYDATVRDADAAFSEMLDDLDEMGIADRTAVALVADHGQELWERGGFGHGRHLYQEVLSVPLVIAAPGLPSGAVERGIGLVDLHATLLDLGGIAPGPSSQGETALTGSDADAIRPVLSHLPGVGRSLIAGRYKLIVPVTGRRAVYDLSTDPAEARNIAGERPVLERYLMNIFGIAVAYERAWSRRRWGDPSNLAAAFAADHGS